MKLAVEEQLQQVAQMLAPKQQTFDFAHLNLWQQLPAADRRACRDAIAALLSQVTLATPNEETQEHDKHE